MTVFTVLFPFSGLGGGAVGFLQASARVLGVDARFRSVGGIDLDPLACADFEYLTGSPALCADIAKLTPAELRDFAGAEPPDVVFLSAPCKGSSKLLPEHRAQDPKYQALNRLSEVWIELMLSTWDVAPRLVLFENVPNITTRASAMLKRVRAALRKAGYVLHDGYHECGELGGLAQRRRRWLMIARHAQRQPPLLYQPPKKRVRGCGEVLGELPMPGEAAGGPLHVLPRLSWLNWIRLALIPAGGDWRDLPGVLSEGQQRREVFKRHEVSRWDAPTGTIAGAGSNGVENVADTRPPRAARLWRLVRAAEDVGAQLEPRTGFDRSYSVVPWDAPANTIAGGSHPGQGAYSVADPRLPDPGSEAPPADLRKAPATPPVIVAEDGTWHRPMTTLELAALQGLPTTVRGEPLRLAGKSQSGWRERIGNAVPPPAAVAVAGKMLVNLLAADAGGYLLDGTGSVWVSPRWQRAVDAGEVEMAAELAS